MHRGHDLRVVGRGLLRARRTARVDLAVAL
jgi:hypothetical protein